MQDVPAGTAPPDRPPPRVARTFSTRLQAALAAVTLWIGQFNLGENLSRFGKNVKKALLDWNLYIAIAGLIIASITFAAGLYALQLQTWTGAKDYLEYCNDNMVGILLMVTYDVLIVLMEKLRGVFLASCQEALAEGIGPLPHTSFSLKNKRYRYQNWRRALSDEIRRNRAGLYRSAPQD